jgi:hypothetical protein
MFKITETDVNQNIKSWAWAEQKLFLFPRGQASCRRLIQYVRCARPQINLRFHCGLLLWGPAAEKIFIPHMGRPQKANIVLGHAGFEYKRLKS